MLDVATDSSVLPHDLDITRIFSSGVTQDALRGRLEQEGKLVIEYGLWSIGFAQASADVVQNLLEASYIAETLGSAADRVRYERISGASYHPVCRFELSSTDPEALAEQVYELSIGLSAEQEDEDAYLSHLEALEEHREEIERDEGEFHCPEIVDDYLANLIHGVYPAMVADLDVERYGPDSDESSERFKEDEEDEDYEPPQAFLSRVYEQHPERRYGFWKSANSATLGFPLYVSPDCWIAPRGTDVEALLAQYSDLPEVEPHIEATFLGSGSYSFLLHASALVHAPFGPLQNALRCAAELGALRHEHEIPDDILLTYSDEEDHVFEHYGIDVHGDLPRPRYLLANSGSSLIVEGGPFTFVLFPLVVKPNQAFALYGDLSQSFAHVADFAGVTSEIRLPWELLNDKSFEELCYDILYHHPKFDPATIDKEGKTNSRDRERDITVYTRELPGRPARKYVFQCKYRKPGTSLGRKSVGNVSDTLLEHRATGYGLMTSVVIDAGVYDKIEAVCESLDRENDNWSVYELERFLARHPRLVERHFGTRTQGS
ncbi:hypothetical protein [Longimicrobium sp.]|jgi:hypothetical protein|uniref:hypothetical protein n=1 Tax=Longimicrobium sp. TaxID=2029185 RepID=UPI002ED7EDF6